jgi:CheY-like chemotaxis protein
MPRGRLKVIVGDGGRASQSDPDEVKAMAYHILIVEDERDTRDMLDLTLRLDGHRVDIASSGRDALRLLAEYSYDVILTDLHMPEMSGGDLCRRIEHGWPHLAPRVVFVTAARPGMSFSCGGRPVPVLAKPYTPERLRQTIEDVVARDV